MTAPTDADMAEIKNLMAEVKRARRRKNQNPKILKDLYPPAERPQEAANGLSAKVEPILQAIVKSDGQPETKDGTREATGKGKGSNTAKAELWRQDMISARDLCNMKFDPLRFAVPKIIPEGLTILAGRPKIGKSWLVLLLGTVLANGVAALGLDYETTKPLKGSVLYLGLEDGRRRLQRRMTKLIGALPDNWPEQLYLKTEWRRFDQGGLEDIRAWHEDSRTKGETPVLVIVDTLAKVRAVGNSKTSPYQNDHDALAGLQKLAEELRIAVVVNHHDRKMDAEDVFDTVSGTLGLTGAVDTILVLTRKSQGTTLHIRGRDIEDECSLAMKFDKTTGQWSVVGSASEVHRSSERTKILKALEGAPEGLSVNEIMVSAGMGTRNATDILLLRLAEEGDIERVKRGLYGLPGTLERIKEKVRTTIKIGKIERSERNHKGAQKDNNLSVNFSDEKDEKDCSANLSDLSGDNFSGKIHKPRDTQEKSDQSFYLSATPAPGCLQCGEPIGPGGREITVRSTGTGQLATVHQDCLAEWQQKGVGERK